MASYKPLQIDYQKNEQKLDVLFETKLKLGADCLPQVPDYDAIMLRLVEILGNHLGLV